MERERVLLSRWQIFKQPESKHERVTRKNGIAKWCIVSSFHTIFACIPRFYLCREACTASRFRMRRFAVKKNWGRNRRRGRKRSKAMSYKREEEMAGNGWKDEKWQWREHATERERERERKMDEERSDTIRKNVARKELNENRTNFLNLRSDW